MSSSRLVRGAKTRMFAIVCLICVLGAVVFVFHGTQAKLVEVQKLVNSCNQQQESLSAQLQVIFEYKGRLEKSLTKEKEDHKQLKETLEGKLNDERKSREKEIQEEKNKHDALVQQNKFQQNQLDDLKDNEKKEVNKLTDENENIRKELELLRKEKSELLEQKTVDLEDLKTKYLKQEDRIKELEGENEDLKSRALPEADRKNYLEKQNFQLGEEIDKLKSQLRDCDDAKTLPKKPKPEVQPDTNVGEMPKLVYSGQKLNGSTTPGLNPEVLNMYEVSSNGPKELDLPPGKNKKNSAAQPIKKPTQESVMPLALPQQQHQQQEDLQQQQELERGMGQIPMPGQQNVNPGPNNPHANTLQKPNTNLVQEGELQVGEPVHGGQGEPDVVEQPHMFVVAPDNNRAEEEDNFGKQPEIPRKNGENYHGGDYEREQPEDEEDDEGEQLDYDAEHGKKEPKSVLQQPVKMPPNHEGGVMVNPK